MCHFVIHFGEALLNRIEFKTTPVSKIKGNNLPQKCLASCLKVLKKKGVTDISGGKLWRGPFQVFHKKTVVGTSRHQIANREIPIHLLQPFHVTLSSLPSLPFAPLLERVKWCLNSVPGPLSRLPAVARRRGGKRNMGPRSDISLAPA